MRSAAGIFAAVTMLVASSLACVARTNDTKAAERGVTTKREPAMEPIFYDIETFEPKPPSGVPCQPLRRVPAAPVPPPVPVTRLRTEQPPYRVAAAKPLGAAGKMRRFVPTDDGIVALGSNALVLLGDDLTPRNDLPAPIGTHVDVPRNLIYTTDVFGGVVARRTSDLAIALRVIPTFPSGYERHVLYVDASKMLLASVQLPQMAKIRHVPDITMFEWWSLGDPRNVNPANAVPADAQVTAVTYSRTRPLRFAAPATTGDPLVLAQTGHLLWFDRALELVADVAVPADIVPKRFAVDAQGRALLIVHTDNADRFWIVDRNGAQVTDIGLSEVPVTETALAIYSPSGNNGFYVVAGDTVVRVDKSGAERWRVRLPSAPAGTTVLDSDGSLLASCGRRLLRLSADGVLDLLYEADRPLVSAPALRRGELLVATPDQILVLEAVK
jgi:hypothetical protein